MRILAALSICALACGGPGKSAMPDDYEKIHGEADPRPPEEEDADGIEDEDAGYDADGDEDDDRILNQHDRCPNDAETYNGFKDEDGCPDIGPVRVWAPHDSHKYSVVIYFQDGSSKISKAAADYVEAMAIHMKASPEFELVAVTGHSAHNEKNPDGLAIARAEVIVEGLVQRGIDADRLEAFGAGSRAELGVSSEWRRRVCFHFLVLSGQTVGRWDGTDVVPVVR